MAGPGIITDTGLIASPSDSTQFLNGNGAFSSPNSSVNAGLPLGPSFGYMSLVAGSGASCTFIGDQAGGFATTNGALGATAPTSTEAAYGTTTTGASASTTSCGTFKFGTSGSAAKVTYGIFRRYIFKGKYNATTNIRYWIGLIDQAANPGSGAGPFNTDTPNANFVGFRFSSTTDTTIKAIAQKSNVAQTVVDTGFTPDTNVHTFSITSNGTTYSFYIDNVLKITISVTDTNAPTTSTASYGGATVDNKNTANNQQLSGIFMYYETV